MEEAMPFSLAFKSDGWRAKRNAMRVTCNEVHYLSN